MRAALFALCILALVSPAVAQTVEPVRIERSGGIFLTAGDIEEDSPFVFSLDFEDAGATLGQPTGVTWTMRFGAYCRDRPSWLQTVVVGPDGQVWRGYRVPVPPGPDRAQDWSSGGNGADRYGGPATPGIVEAMAQGGRVTLALEDDRGERWNAVTIDTLSPADRESLYQAFVSGSPEPAADEWDGMVEVETIPGNTPRRPGRCP